jgi:glycolate oxidase FAD binding subunit
MASITVEAIQERLAEAAAKHQPLELIAGGTKRGIGRPVRGPAGEALPLHLAGLSGVIDYQPRELILVARPGTRLDELEPLLAKEGQVLAFEPPHWGAGATLGGALACNLSGPRRFKAGAARDHLLGFQAISGTGDVFRGGGRVVKNVTGYDLSKLLCGSFGTLAVMTEVCVKVLPRGETERTVAIATPSAEEAQERLIAVAKTPHEVSGLAFLPGNLALPAALKDFAQKGGVTVMRIEGSASSVTYRATKLAELAAGQAETLDESASRDVWRAIRELEPLPLHEGETLWRFSVPPTRGLRLADALAMQGAARGFADWGGALIWAALPMAADPAALHRAATEAGGHARLLRSTKPLPDEYPIFPAQPPARAKLHENIKRAFDPHGILNPGRMYGEW